MAHQLYYTHPDNHSSFTGYTPHHPLFLALTTTH